MSASSSGAGSASGPATPSGVPGPTSSRPNPGLPNIPKYELTEEIGHGGMATVYRARDPRLNRDVAVKVIHRHLRENGEVATRFVAEARAAAKLRHPGIVEVYDVSNEDDNERFLVVELLRGTTLRKVLQAHREMPAEVGASIVHELCSAIEHAHEAGIIHRDIKPENVLVEMPADRERDRAVASSKPGPNSGPTDIDVSPPFTAANDASPSDTQQSIRDEVVPHGTHADKEKKKSNAAKTSPPNGSSRRSNPDSKKSRPIDVGVVIKLTDFGIAKILDAQGVTSTGQVLGSPAHMAPEQIEGGDVDARTDVFALGVLMYECLVGHLPFEGKNPAQVLRKVLDGIYPPADRDRSAVGGRWAKIIAAALARDAAQRTPTPAALAEQILAELKELGVNEPKAEIAAYFADPNGYTDAHEKRLVPRLLARGEAARKAGNVPKAAADFNRALALRPSDLAILKRVGSLATTASRRVMLKRGAMILGGTVAIGCAAFAVTRLLKRPTLSDSGGAQPNVIETVHGELGPMPMNHSRAVPEPASSAEQTAPTRVRAEPHLAHSSAAAVTPPVSAADAGAPAGAKKVSFIVYPGGAKLFIDNKLVDWQGAVFSLTPGPHLARATVEGNCCKSPYEKTFNVWPDKDAQQVTFLMDLLPATIEARGPSGAYVCSNNLAGPVPGTRSLKMSNVRSDKVSCDFTPSDGGGHKSQRITINAGATTVLDFSH